MNKIVKTMFIASGVMASGIIGYSVLNKKLRKKMMDYKNTLTSEMKNIVK